MKHKKQKGFTLIEMLVVIAIIGLLSSVIFASLKIGKTQANDARRLQDIKALGTAMDLYFADHNVYPFDTAGYTITSNQAAWESQLGPELRPYLPKMPQPPNQNAGPYVYSVLPPSLNVCIPMSFAVSCATTTNYAILAYAVLENPKGKLALEKNGFYFLVEYFRDGWCCWTYF